MNAPPVIDYAPAWLTDETAYAPIIAWLEEHGSIRNVSADAVQRTAREKRESQALALNRLGAVGDDELREAFCAVTSLPPGVPTISERARLDERVQALNNDFLKFNRAVVLDISDAQARVGLVDPLNRNAIDGLAFALKCELELCVLRARDERRLQAERMALEADDWEPDFDGADHDKLKRTLEFDRDAPIARRVSNWLSQAVEQRASDVHIEPRPHALIVRYRIDGVLHTIAREAIESASAVLARVKVLADLDLGERRTAQDGRASIVVGGRSVDVRISIVPSVHGESAVLRILDRGEIALNFKALGFSASELSLLSEAVSWPHGLFLVTGPTGSGKTTTLYAALETMRGDKRKILAVEDPVEFHFDHVTQVQVAPKAGVTFASSIRAFLRQDPDVIFVGEIRDVETARAAIRAALTGHLVLATLHAIDATRALPRLLDMEVEPFQLSACFRASLAQRLVRRLCPICRTSRRPTASECEDIGLSPHETVWDAVGCSDCGETGYRGRLAIAEALRGTEAIAAAIRRNENLVETAQAALVQTLRDDALVKVRGGLTSPGEIKRALSG